MGLGIGLIIAVLLPVAILLFGVLTPVQTVSAILLMSGLWTLLFGVLWADKASRLYFSGYGVIAAVLSTFLFLPIQYTAGLVVLAIVGLVVVYAAKRS